MVSQANKIAGSVYGLAFGDAWGYVTEFHSYATNMSTQPEPPNPLVISDDTQMSLYNIYALQNLYYTGWLTPERLEALGTDVSTQNHIRKTFADEHVNFYYDADNNRAPGQTCMTALSLYVQRTQGKEDYLITGLEGGHNLSKGCGANMRAPWLGLLPFTREQITYLAILQAQTTHGHQTGWVAAAITALIVHGLFHEGVNMKDLFGYSLACLDEIDAMDSPLITASRDGINEVKAGLQESSLNIHRYLSNAHPVDINSYFGEGWVAEQALYNGIAVMATQNSNFKESMKTLVYTQGDSDSIAAIGGGFWGSYYGFDNLNVEIKDNLEPRYKAELANVTLWLQELNESHADR